jgi:DNA helicase-2/ATP-dependent DNA helicase PcrA
MIVAGPGAGKTTVLVLRALRLVYVDGLQPTSILVTTFTRKAAMELRSRLLEWGFLIRRHLEQNRPTGAPPAFDAWLRTIDVNQFVTGTLDSICEDVTTSLRDPGVPIPVLLESFVANAIFLRRGIFPTGAWNAPDVNAFLAQFTFAGTPPRNVGETLSVSRTLIDRFIHDRVDLNSFVAAVPHTSARARLRAAFDAYRQYMDAGQRLDFARLEERFLERLTAGGYERFVQSIRAVLVDEYQDTNPLQEQIYFRLVDRANASLTVVGDDDQSLYRFRGATVELFRDFENRLHTEVPRLPRATRLDLLENYRSTPEIVAFVNDYITNDPGFSNARVQPLKPPITAMLPSAHIPVLGMFRTDRNVLANDLTTFLLDVFRGPGRQIPTAAGQTLVVRHPNGGDFGDAVFLSHTVNEFRARWGNNPPEPRLPALMRDRLRQHGVGVFNPRGRFLRDVPAIGQLLGLVLECIDPTPVGSWEGAQELAIHNQLRADARTYFRIWRRAARDLIAANPAPRQPHGLGAFVAAWQQRQPQSMAQWPSEWPLLELCFTLITWIPELQNDPEGQVHLEAVARCFAEAATFSSYRSSITHGQAPHDANSVKAALRDALAPIAEEELDVDEEIMTYVPRNYLTFMTIHQAKGLEYPLVIVDVASDFERNAATQRFRRFPDQPSSVARMEDDLAPHTPVGPLRLARQAIDRTFDDLIRLYYVAYSRPQSALLLVGLLNCLRYSTTVRHVATFWHCNGNWPWRNPCNGPPPGQADNIPLTLI